MNGVIGKQLIPTGVPGEFNYVEQHSNDKWGPWENKLIVYGSKEQAAIEGNKAAVGNAVFVGVQKVEFEGKEFYYPGMNVWD